MEEKFVLSWVSSSSDFAFRTSSNLKKRRSKTWTFQLAKIEQREYEEKVPFWYEWEKKKWYFISYLRPKYRRNFLHGGISTEIFAYHSVSYSFFHCSINKCIPFTKFCHTFCCLGEISKKGNWHIIILSLYFGELIESYFLVLDHKELAPIFEE